MKKILLILTIFTFVMISCEKSNVKEVEPENTLRKKILSLETREKVKSQYKQLTESQKAEVWISKLNQILDKNISTAHNVYFKKLINEIEANDRIVMTDIIRENAIAIAKITPRGDFVNMFAVLNDYEAIDKFQYDTEDICYKCIKEIKDYKFEAETNSNLRIPDCNCDWTCGSCSSAPHPNCLPTSSGCGFLWLFSCGDYCGPIINTNTTNNEVSGTYNPATWEESSKNPAWEAWQN